MTSLNHTITDNIDVQLPACASHPAAMLVAAASIPAARHIEPAMPVSGTGLLPPPSAPAEQTSGCCRSGASVLCKSFAQGPEQGQGQGPGCGCSHGHGPACGHGQRHGPEHCGNDSGAAGRVASSRHVQVPELVPCPGLSPRLWLELIEYLEEEQAAAASSHGNGGVGGVMDAAAVGHLAAAATGMATGPSMDADTGMAAGPGMAAGGSRACGRDSSWSLHELAGEVKCESHAFARLLFEFMHSRDISAVNCYRSADIDRRHFSRLKSSTAHPSRNVILRFALALKLSLEDTDRLLATEGFALSSSIPEDRALAYFIRRGIWSRFVINEALFALKLNLI